MQQNEAALPTDKGAALAPAVVSGGRRAHRRGRSEPLTPAHRLALATERESARLSEGKTVCVAEEVVEPLPFRRVPSLPTFLAYEKWRPQPEWTARAASALHGWCAVPLRGRPLARAVDARAGKKSRGNEGISWTSRASLPRRKSRAASEYSVTRRDKFQSRTGGNINPHL